MTIVAIRHDGNAELACWLALTKENIDAHCQTLNPKHTLSPSLQAELRKEAALSAVDEQRRNKQAIEAENAANIAKMTENESAVSETLNPQP